MCKDGWNFKKRLFANNFPLESKNTFLSKFLYFDGVMEKIGISSLICSLNSLKRLLFKSFLVSPFSYPSTPLIAIDLAPQKKLLYKTRLEDLGWCNNFS